MLVLVVWWCCVVCGGFELARGDELAEDVTLRLVRLLLLGAPPLLDYSRFTLIWGQFALWQNYS